MRNHLIAVLLMGAVTAPAAAQDRVELASAVYVEHMGHTPDGRIERKIRPASQVTRGDRVVLMVEWQAPRRGGGFTVTNAIPDTLAFELSGHDGEQVSADGGRSWGELGRLHVTDAYGTRIASPRDITHVRWAISRNEAAQGKGRITYSAIVR